MYRIFSFGISSSVMKAALWMQVSDPIIVAACTLYDCDLIDKKVEGPLRKAGNVIKDVSNINCEGWDLLKLATAVKLICFPGEEIAVGNPQEV